MDGKGLKFSFEQLSPSNSQEGATDVNEAYDINKLSNSILQTNIEVDYQRIDEAFERKRSSQSIESVFGK